MQKIKFPIKIIQTWKKVRWSWELYLEEKKHLIAFGTMLIYIHHKQNKKNGYSFQYIIFLNAVRLDQRLWVRL